MPRQRLLLAIIVLVALIGLADASYLTYEHYNGLKGLACFSSAHGGHSSCFDVQSSQWSVFLGVPVALLGLVGYVILLSTLAIRTEMGRMLTFLVAALGLAFSVYLTYREAYSIHHYCEWCLGSATCLLVLTLLTAIRFMTTVPPLEVESIDERV